MKKDIEFMINENWMVMDIKESHKKTLGCSGCCILPFPLFWYSKDYEVDYKKDEEEENKDQEYVPLEQEYDARNRPEKV